MRTLNDYFLSCGTWTNIGTASAVADVPVVIPDTGYIRSILIGITGAAIATANVVTIFKNGSTTGSTVTLPDLMAAGTYRELTPSARVEVAIGDRITLVSGGETTTTPAASATLVVRR